MNVHSFERRPEATACLRPIGHYSSDRSCGARSGGSVDGCEQRSGDRPRDDAARPRLAVLVGGHGRRRRAAGDRWADRGVNDPVPQQREPAAEAANSRHRLGADGGIAEPPDVGRLHGDLRRGHQRQRRQVRQLRATVRRTGRRPSVRVDVPVASRSPGERAHHRGRHPARACLIDGEGAGAVRPRSGDPQADHTRPAWWPGPTNRLRVRRARHEEPLRGLCRELAAGQTLLGPTERFLVQ